MGGHCMTLHVFWWYENFKKWTGCTHQMFSDPSPTVQPKMPPNDYNVKVTCQFEGAKTNPEESCI